MGRRLQIMQDDNVLIDYDKQAGTSRMQFAYVQRMDEHMNQGIRLHGEFVRDPDPKQRMAYVIGELLQALNRNDRRNADMMCRYLAHRVPELDSIRLTDTGDSVDVDLQFDPAATPE